MNKVLIVAYYTPPLGLSGVMRVTKLAKYLPDFGWEPLILTVRPVAYYAYDPALLNDLNRAQVFRTESLDPNRILYRLGKRRMEQGLGSAEDGANRGWISLLARLSRTVLFPDTKIGWLPFALNAGMRIIRRERPAVIVATAPPWTCLLVGAKLAQKSGLPFVADFRDPWPGGFRTPRFWKRRLLVKLRDRILDQAQLVLVVNKGTGERLCEFSPSPKRWEKLKEKVVLLENGFDPEEFAVAPEVPGGWRMEQGVGSRILYVGNLWENRREIAAFVQALAAVPFARLYIAGRLDEASARTVKRSPQVELLGVVPHSRALALMKGADVLLYIGKPEQPVGLKLYEYIGAGRPIVVWKSETGSREEGAWSLEHGAWSREAEEIVKELDAGAVCCDAEGLKRFLSQVPGAWSREHGAGSTEQKAEESGRERFNRRLQAERLAGYLNSLVRQ